MKEMKVMDRDGYLVGAARTAIGAFGEALKDVPLSQPAAAVFERA